MIGTLIISDIGRRAAGFLAVTLVLAAPGLAGENAILANGFRIHADRHEVVGNTVKLFAGAGFTELPSSQIAGFEREESVPPPAPAIVPQVLTAPPVAPVPEIETEIQPLDPRRLAAEAARRNNLPEALIRSVIHAESCASIADCRLSQQMEALIRSVMHAESGFQLNALSPKGAIGLMQLMPGTAEQLHADPYDPKQNVEAGTAYLRALLVKYDKYDDQVARAVAAYNAGPAAVDRYNGVPPYRETHDYVIRVLTEYLKSNPATTVAPPNTP
jgi:soluble lytic murein transglycosylase-like protein